MDVEGKEREIRDAEGRAVMRYDYDLIGNRIRHSSMEAGERWMLNDVAGNPIRAWNSRGFTRRMIYDELRRPRELWIDSGQGEWLAEETVYGEDQGDALNHRGRVYRVYDGAGLVTNEIYDFKGNSLHSARRLTVDYKQSPNWAADPRLEPRELVSTARFDALNRPVELIAPDGSVVRPGYNDANLLETIEVNLRGASETMTFVADIDYDVCG